VYASWRTRDAQNLFVRAADGAGSVEQLTTARSGRLRRRSRRTARMSSGTSSRKNAATSLWWRSRIPQPIGDRPSGAASSSHVEPLIQTPFNEFNGEISPDGATSRTSR